MLFFISRFSVIVSAEDDTSIVDGITTERVL